jgi:hypothetical protein
VYFGELLLNVCGRIVLGPSGTQLERLADMSAHAGGKLRYGKAREPGV